LSSLNRSFGRENLSFLLESILHDHFINNLATENASPSKKFFADAVEFFENHCSTTSIALHNKPPFLKFADLSAISVPILKFTYKINILIVLKKLRTGEKWCLEGKFV